MVKIEIPGEPVPCARPRLSAAGGFVRVHDSQHKRKAAIKALARVEWNRQLQGKPLDGPVTIGMTFYCSPPSGLSMCNRNLHAWGVMSNASKPDCDNLSKTYMDVLNGLAYHDDRQVIALNCRKRYSLTPKTEIEIMAVSEIHTETAHAAILSKFGPDALADLATLTNDLQKALAIASRIDPESPDCDIVMRSIAKIISRVADTHAKGLSRITKEHGGYYLSSKD